MIVRMSKVEIAGPKELLGEALVLLRDLGLFQVEPDTVGFIAKEEEQSVRSFSLDERTALERVFLEDLRQKIEHLFSFLPSHAVRECYIEPFAIVDTIAGAVERHTDQARDLAERRDALQKERAELDRYAVFLGALASLLESAQETPSLDFIGLTIREPEMVGRLRDVI